MLHEVDFNQLKIENKQYLEKIDEKNQELLRLKLMAGNTLQILNHFKVWSFDNLLYVFLISVSVKISVSGALIIFKKINYYVIRNSKP